MVLGTLDICIHSLEYMDLSTLFFNINSLSNFYFFCLI
jgi:hypothetical protein